MSTLVDADRAGVGRDQADDHVEARRLAGAVRAEQADDFALVERELEAAHDRAAAKALLQSGRAQHQCWSVAASAPALGFRLRRRRRGLRRGAVGRALFFGSMTICTRLAGAVLSPALHLAGVRVVGHVRAAGIRRGRAGRRRRCRSARRCWCRRCSRSCRCRRSSGRRASCCCSMCACFFLPIRITRCTSPEMSLPCASFASPACW